MKRSAITLEQVAEWNNLHLAWFKARRGLARPRAAIRFEADLDRRLAGLGERIRAGEWLPGPFNRFSIRDPKPRTIHAPALEDRLVHHALMNHAGPVIERALIDDCFACRKGKGTIAAVKRCQSLLRRGDWTVQIDIASYFASIDHHVLKTLLARRFKNPGLLDFMSRIIDGFEHSPGKGLPIGALSSQQFANLYLDGVDRLLCRHPGVRGLVRYMDDVVWVCTDRVAARDSLDRVREHLAEGLRLVIKPTPRIGRTEHGVVFCGHRIKPRVILLSRRRKQRYARARSHWERAWLTGRIDDLELQRNMDAVIGTTVHAQASEWRREQLRRSPLEPCRVAGVAIHPHKAHRVVRGGAWNNKARNVRSAMRNHNAPDDRNNNLGFRCARAHGRCGFTAAEQVDRPADVTHDGIPAKPNGPRCPGSRSSSPSERSPVGRPHPCGVWAC